MRTDIGTRQGSRNDAAARRGIFISRPSEGFTLVELLVVCLIIVVLTTLVVQAVVGAQESASQTQCASRLHQVYQGFLLYKGEYKKLPSAKPPDGFDDAFNWKDLWEHSDIDGQYFTEKTVMIGPIAVTTKNKTHWPRLPRLLETYTDSVEVLHCTDQGASAYWPDVGPYYYNTTDPFETKYASGALVGAWYPMLEFMKKQPNNKGWRFEALAACQNPDLGKSYNGWRHGKKGVASEGGLNNHLYMTGNVKTLMDPQSWRE